MKRIAIITMGVKLNNEMCIRDSGADMWGATMFDQLVCRVMFHQMRYEGIFTPPSEQGTLVVPGNLGMFEWGGISVDPNREVAIANPKMCIRDRITTARAGRLILFFT